MRSSRAGQLGRDRSQPQSVDQSLECRRAARRPGPAGGPRRARPRRAGARNGPSRLNPSGSAPSAGAVGHATPGPGRRRRRGRRAARVTAVGRNDVTPRRSSARAMPSSAAASPIASWPPQPWTWTSTKPGAMYGPSSATAPSSRSTAAIRPSSIVSRPGATRSSRTSRPSIGRGHRARRRADPGPAPRRRTARRARTARRRSATRSPRPAGRASSTMTRRSTSSGSPGPHPEQPGVLGRRRGRGDRAGPAAQPNPARPSVSWSEPAVEVGGHHGVAQAPIRTVGLERDRLAIGQAQPAQVDDRLAAGMPRLVASLVGWRADHPGQHAASSGPGRPAASPG